MGLQHDFAHRVVAAPAADAVLFRLLCVGFQSRQEHVHGSQSSRSASVRV